MPKGIRGTRFLHDRCGKHIRIRSASGATFRSDDLLRKHRQDAPTEAPPSEEADSEKEIKPEEGEVETPAPDLIWNGNKSGTSRSRSSDRRKEREKKKRKPLEKQFKKAIAGEDAGVSEIAGTALSSLTPGELAERMELQHGELRGQIAEFDRETQKPSLGQRFASWERKGIAAVAVLLVCGIGYVAMQLPALTKLDDTLAEPVLFGDQTDPTEIADGFMNAESLDERLQWVRDSGIYAEEIAAHFEATKETEGEVDFIRPLGKQVLAPDIVQSFQVKFTSGRSRLIAVVEDEGKRVVDWECYARKGTATFAELTSGAVAAADVRAFAKTSNYYNSEFSDQSVYRALELSSPDWPESIYGYVERGSPTALCLLKHARAEVRSQSGKKKKAKQHRVTVRVEPRGNSHRYRQFKITRALSYSWVRPDGEDIESNFAMLGKDLPLTEEQENRRAIMKGFRERRAASRDRFSD